MTGKAGHGHDGREAVHWALPVCKEEADEESDDPRAGLPVGIRVGLQITTTF